MNAKRSLNTHQVYIGLGSNINPEDNLRSAVALLRHDVRIEQISSVWESPAIGSTGPNFLNAAVQITTPFSAQDLKDQVLRRIETELGRTRSLDQNAPRTVDLDILVYNGVVVEPELWQRAYEAVPLAEIAPDIKHPVTQEPLWSIAQAHARKISIRPYVMPWQLVKG